MLFMLQKNPEKIPGSYFKLIIYYHFACKNNPQSGIIKLIKIFEGDGQNVKTLY